MNKWLLVKVSVRVRVFGLDMTESVRIIREDRDGRSIIGFWRVIKRAR